MTPKSLLNYHNLSFSLQFEPSKNFIIFGELFAFQIKIDFSAEAIDENEDFTDLLSKLGCSVESIEICEDSDALRDLSTSSSLIKSKSSTSIADPPGSSSFYIGKAMKSVESLPSMPKQTKLTLAPSKLASPTLSQSLNTLSSTISDKLNTFPCRNIRHPVNNKNNNINVLNTWNKKDRSFYVPVEVFIDGESISLPRSMVKLKISLNELVPQTSQHNLTIFDGQSDGFNFITLDSSDFNYNFEKITRISLIEGFIPVIRPLEVNLRTHQISKEEVLLNLSLNYDLIRCQHLTYNTNTSNSLDHSSINNISNDSDFLTDKFDFKIDDIDVLISDHFTSKKLTIADTGSVNTNKDDFFLIKSILPPEQRKNMVLVGPKQEYSMVYRLNCLKPINNLNYELEFGENHRLKVDIKGSFIPKVAQTTSTTEERRVILSFECPIDLLSYFPPQNNESEVKVLFKLLSEPTVLKAFEPFSIEISILNFSKNFKSFLISYIGDRDSKQLELDKDKNGKNQKFKFSHSIQEFYYENDHLLQCDPTILSYDFFDKPVLIENIPSNGSKQIRLRFIPMGIGCVSLDGFILTDLESNRSKRVDNIFTLQIE